MTAPERIWAWRFITPKVLPEIKGGWTDEHDRRETEYILHTRAALAASPLVQDERLRCMQIVYQRMEIIAASDVSDSVKIAISDILLKIIKDIENASD